MSDNQGEYEVNWRAWEFDVTMHAYFGNRSICGQTIVPQTGNEIDHKKSGQQRCPECVYRMVVINGIDQLNSLVGALIGMNSLMLYVQSYPISAKLSKEEGFENSELREKLRQIEELAFSPAFTPDDDNDVSDNQDVHDQAEEFVDVKGEDFSKGYGEDGASGH